MEYIDLFFGDIWLVFPSHMKFWIILLTYFITGSGTSLRLAQSIRGAKARLIIIEILPFNERVICFHIILRSWPLRGNIFSLIKCLTSSCRVFMTLLIVLNSNNNQAPSYLCETLKSYQTQHVYNTVGPTIQTT